MRVSIIVPDRRVIVDGVARVLDVDWAPFAGVHAVQAWLDRDRAEVEYASVDPDGDGPLPSFKPPNELIDAAAFYLRFGSLLDAHAAVIDEPAPLYTSQEPSNTHTVTVGDAVAQPSRESLMARIAALEAIVAGHARSFELINKMDLGGG